MIAHFKPLSNWLARFSGRSAVPLSRPTLAQLAQPKAQLPAFVADATLAQRYLALLGPLDWDHFPERGSGKVVTDEITDLQNRLNRCVE